MPFRTPGGGGTSVPPNGRRKAWSLPGVSQQAVWGSDSLIASKAPPRAPLPRSPASLCRSCSSSASSWAVLSQGAVSGRLLSTCLDDFLKRPHLCGHSWGPEPKPWVQVSIIPFLPDASTWTGSWPGHWTEPSLTPHQPPPRQHRPSDTPDVAIYRSLPFQPTFASHPSQSPSPGPSASVTGFLSYLSPLPQPSLAWTAPVKVPLFPEANYSSLLPTSYLPKGQTGSFLSQRTPVGTTYWKSSVSPRQALHLDPVCLWPHSLLPTSQSSKPYPVSQTQPNAATLRSLHLSYQLNGTAASFEIPQLLYGNCCRLIDCQDIVI